MGNKITASDLTVEQIQNGIVIYDPDTKNYANNVIEWQVLGKDQDGTNTITVQTKTLVGDGASGYGNKIGDRRYDPSRNILNSELQTWLDSEFYNHLGSDFRSKIIPVTKSITPYQSGDIVSLQCKLFNLSFAEVGGGTSIDYSPETGAFTYQYYQEINSTSSSTKRVHIGGSSSYWWLRSPNAHNSSNVWAVGSDGHLSSNNVNSKSNGSAPACVLPSSLQLEEDANGKYKIVFSLPTISKPAMTTTTYAATGSTITPILEGYDSETMTMSGDTSAIVAGNYTLSVSPKSGYIWTDETTTAVDYNWNIRNQQFISHIQIGNNIYDIKGSSSGVSSISKTQIDLLFGISNKLTLPTQKGTLIYSGTSQSPQWNDYDSEKMSVTGNSGINANIYTATFTPKNEYIWRDDQSTNPKDVTWIINKADGNVTVNTNNIILNSNNNNYTLTLTEATGTATVTSSDTNLVTVTKDNSNTYTISNPNRKNGTCNIIIDIAASADGNYKSYSKEITVNSDFKVSIPYPSVNVGSNNSYDERKWGYYHDDQIIFDNTVKQPTYKNYDPDKMEISGTTSATESGTYSVYFTPKEGYCWENGTTSRYTCYWYIVQYAPDISNGDVYIVDSNGNNINGRVFNSTSSPVNIELKIKGYENENLDNILGNIKWHVQRTGQTYDDYISVVNTGKSTSTINFYGGAGSTQLYADSSKNIDTSTSTFGGIASFSIQYG